jgi:hypothetical protein
MSDRSVSGFVGSLLHLQDVDVSVSDDGSIGHLRPHEDVGLSVGSVRRSRRDDDVNESVGAVGGFRRDEHVDRSVVGVGDVGVRIHNVVAYAGSSERREKDAGQSVGEVGGIQRDTHVGQSVGGVRDYVGASVGASVGGSDSVEKDDEIIPVDESPFRPVYADEDEEDDTEDPFSQFEIYGLSASSNGRSCHVHTCCGSQVAVGDVVRLKKTIVECDTGLEEAICCVLVRCGRETCTVGFVPRPIIGWQPIVDHLNRHAQVVELYVVSRNTQKRRKNHMNCGVAGCIFLDEIPQIE